jgi:hypothetical protein
MGDLGEFGVTITGNASGLSAALDGATQAVTSFGDIVAGVFSGELLAAGVESMISSIGKLTSTFLNFATEFQDTFEAIGIGLGSAGSGAENMGSGIAEGLEKARIAAEEAQDELIRFNEKVEEIQDNIANVMAGQNIIDAEQALADKLTDIKGQIDDIESSLADKSQNRTEDLNTKLLNSQEKYELSRQEKVDAFWAKYAGVRDARSKALLQKELDAELAVDDKKNADKLALEKEQGEKANAVADARDKEYADKQVAKLNAEIAKEQEASDKKVAILDKENATKLEKYQKELDDEYRSHQLYLDKLDLANKEAASGGGTSAMSIIPKGGSRVTTGEYTALGENIEGIVGSVEKLATTSPFKLNDIEQASRLFKTANLNIEQLSPAMANFAAVSGMSLQETASMMDSAIHGRGMQILQKLSLNANELTVALGHPVKSANDVAKALEIIGTRSDRFAGASKKMSEDFGGQMNILNNKIILLGINILGISLATGEPIKGGLFDNLTKLLDKLNAWFDAHGSDIKAFFTTIGGILDTLYTKIIKPLFDGIANWVSGHKEEINTFLKAAGDILKDIGKYALIVIDDLKPLAPLLGIVAEAFGLILLGALDVVKIALKAIDALIKGVQITFNQFKDVVKGIPGAIKEGWNDLVSFFEGITDKIEGFFKKVGSGISKAFNMNTKNSPSLKENIDESLGYIKDQYATLGDVYMPNFGKIAPSYVQNYNYNTNTSQPNISQNNSFNVAGEASGRNVASFLGFELEHLGIV